MPELPEVETVRRGLLPALEGRRIRRAEQRRLDLRFPLPDAFASRLSGRRIERLGRRAKFLLADLDGGETLLMHLGMSGRFTVLPATGSASRPGTFALPAAGTGPDGTGPHDHVVLDMEDGTRLVYTDHRRFGFMDLWPTETLASNPHLASLGPEPLGNSFNAVALAKALAGRRCPLKAALLDQRVVAGLGNIYVCEALYRAGLSPRRKAATLVRKDGSPTARADELAATIRKVLEEAIAAGGSSLRDYAHTDGELGYFQHAFAVYDREGEPCSTPECGATVKRIVQSSRSTFFCPQCQR